MSRTQSEGDVTFLVSERGGYCVGDDGGIIFRRCPNFG